MKKINVKTKTFTKAGSAWTAMMGVSVLGGVANSIANTVLSYTNKSDDSYTTTQGTKKQSAYVRLSPYPNRTTVGLYL